MIKLFESPPRSIKFKKIKIPVSASFSTVLKINEILNDDLLTSTEKIDLCVDVILRIKLSKFISFHWKEMIFSLFVDQILHFDDNKNNSTKVLDFTQDAEYIFSAFFQTYHINLFKDKIHWWNFLMLLGGLPENTRLMEIVSIRSRPLPKPTKYNAEERAALIKLKMQFALKLSPEERKQKYQEGLQNMAKTLISLSQKSKNG